MSVFGRNADNVLRDLSHAGAWGQCVTVHHDNKTATRDVVRGWSAVYSKCDESGIFIFTTTE